MIIPNSETTHLPHRNTDATYPTENTTDFNLKSVSHNCVHLWVTTNLNLDPIKFLCCSWCQTPMNLVVYTIEPFSGISISLRPPWGFIPVFSTLYNKAVLLSYAFTLGPYNSMVLYPTNPLKFPPWVKSGLSVTFWQCIMKYSYSFTIGISTDSTTIKNYCHYLRSTWFTHPGPLNRLT